MVLNMPHAHSDRLAPEINPCHEVYTVHAAPVTTHQPSLTLSAGLLIGCERGGRSIGIVAVMR